MEISISEIKNKLVEKGLKITPQRIAILEAIYTLNNHPTAEMIMAYIKESHPSIASGTIYKVLDTLVENQLIKRVKTENDVKRFDGLLENHHHLYCSESDVIKDYKNEELDRLLTEYFKKNRIDNFEIEDIKLQINGRTLKRGRKK